MVLKVLLNSKHFIQKVIVYVNVVAIVVVANVRFSSLKLLIYEPIIYALVGWSARPRLEPLQAIGTRRALPRPPSTRLGCHYCIYCIFVFLD